MVGVLSSVRPGVNEICVAYGVSPTYAILANFPERYGTPDLVALTITELVPEGGLSELLA